MTKIEGWKLKQRQSLPLEVKIKTSLRKIEKFIEAMEGKVYVSYSGGKDSEVLLHLVKQVKPDVDVVFVDNKMEIHTREHALKKATIVLKPKLTVFAVWDKYGVPFPSKQQADYIYKVKHTKSDYLKSRLLTGIMKDGSKTMFKLADKWKPIVESDIEVSDKCCHYLKKEPIKRYEKISGNAGIMGTMASDGFERKKLYLQNGCFNIDKRKATPIGFWTEQDVLRYIIKFKLDLCPAYGEIIEEDGVLKTTKAKRTGCVGCGFGVHLESSPNRYQRLYKENQTAHKAILHSWCGGSLGKICKMYDIPTGEEDEISQN